MGSPLWIQLLLLSHGIDNNITSDNTIIITIIIIVESLYCGHWLVIGIVVYALIKEICHGINGSPLETPEKVTLM